MYNCKDHNWSSLFNPCPSCFPQTYTSSGTVFEEYENDFICRAWGLIDTRCAEQCKECKEWMNENGIHKEPIEQKEPVKEDSNDIANSACVDNNMFTEEQKKYVASVDDDSLRFHLLHQVRLRDNMESDRNSCQKECDKLLQSLREKDRQSLPIEEGKEAIEFGIFLMFSDESGEYQRRHRIYPAMDGSDNIKFKEQVKQIYQLFKNNNHG